MDRDEFMELVYETFADEPDNVLANGIIEAADAYVEHEKAQLFKEGTTKDTISRQAAIDVIEDYPHGNVWNVESMEEMVDKIKVLPTVQPEPTDISAKEAVYNLAEKIGIHQLFALTVELRGEPAQPEPAIPLSWIEEYIEWIKSVDNEFTSLEAAHISVMVKKWRDEKNGRTD